MNVFSSWLEGQRIKDHCSHPNIEVGDFSYYSGYYHGKSFEECVVRYLLGDAPTWEVWESGRYPDIDKLIIGKFCSIASGATFMLAGNQGHRIDWISTFPFSDEFGEGVRDGFQRAGNTVVGHDVWIGTEAMIMPGVQIGNGAVIGARAVITKPVTPYTVVVGNNQVVKKRFDEPSIEILQSIQWWDWSIDQLKEAMPILCSGDIPGLKQFYMAKIAPSSDKRD